MTVKNLLFCAHTYTMYELRNQHVSLVRSQYGVNNYCVLCTVEAKKAKNSLQQRTLYHNHFAQLINYGVKRQLGNGL